MRLHMSCFSVFLTNVLVSVYFLPLQRRPRDARANITGGSTKMARTSAPVANTSAPASTGQWAAFPFAPATCPWRPLPALRRSWSRCQASAASASTATRGPPSCPQCTADPNLQRTRLTPSSHTRRTLTQSLTRNPTGSCTPTNPKRRRTPWATSWWRWGASGTSHVETSTWRVRGRLPLRVASESRLFPPRSKASCLCFSHFSLLTHKRPHCEPFPSASVCQHLCEACFPLAPCTPEVLSLAHTHCSHTAHTSVTQLSPLCNHPLYASVLPVQ